MDAEDLPRTSSKLSDNPFMRRDSKSGVSPQPNYEKKQAYPVPSSVETLDRPTREKVSANAHDPQQRMWIGTQTC